MCRRLLYSVFFLLCVQFTIASVYAPVSTYRDLRNGDSVVVAIQNGKYPDVWYAVKYNASDPYVNNTMKVDVEEDGTIRFPDPSIVWRCDSGYNYSDHQKFTFRRTENGNDKTYLLNQSYFYAAIASNKPYPHFRLYTNYTRVVLMWRADVNGERFDINKENRDLFYDQLVKDSTLRTGAGGFMFFRKVAQVHFDACGHGSTPERQSLTADSKGKIVLPSVNTTAHYKFLGWARYCNSSVVDVGVAGDKITAEDGVTYYAIYRERSVSNQCIDFTDIFNEDVCSCRYGSCSRELNLKDPDVIYPEHGRKTKWSYYGPKTGQFTVCTDPSQRETFGSQVPPGETASVRLGDHTNNCDIAWIEYACIVDTTFNPILQLKWAAYMEQPGHGASDQPRFFMEIMDDENVIIDSKCGAFDFVASSNMSGGWKGGGSSVYHPWTTLSVDLSPYHGRRVTIRLAAYDCAQGAHYGFANFSLNCKPKKIDVTSCAEMGGLVRMEAPDGFFYHWYTETQDFGTDRVVMVPPSEELYYCDISTLEDGSCSFTLSAYARATYPVAAFDVQYIPGVCSDTVRLTNRSFVTEDGVTPIPGRECDNYHWSFGRSEGDTLNLPNPPQEIIYSTPGTYTISLKAGLNDWACQDDSSFIFTVEAALPHRVLYDTICQYDDMYCNGKFLPAMAAGDTVYTDTILNSGCLDSIFVERHCHVWPTYRFVEYDTLCRGTMRTWRGQTLDYPGTYYDSYQTVRGCDSIYIMHLTYRKERVEQSILYDTICAGETYYWRGRTFTTTGFWSDTLSSVVGCDSITSLSLLVRPANTHRGAEPFGSDYWKDPFPAFPDEPRDKPTYPEINSYAEPDWEHAIIDYGQTYEWRGRVLDATGFYTDTLLTQFGCDSVLGLQLKVLDPCEMEPLTLPYRAMPKKKR